MKNRKISRKGFTLIELVLVLFLASLILGAVALLTRETMTSLKFLQEKSRTLQSATLGLERLASELSEAVDVTDSGNPITFLKVDPNEPEAMGIILDDPNDPSDVFTDVTAWPNTYPSPVTVTYETTYLSGVGTMTRSVGGQVAVVAGSIEDFQATPFSGRNDIYEVVLSIQENRRVISFRTYTMVPAMTR